MSKIKSKRYYFNLQARGYELDSYGHVNNAVYLNYNEQARWDLFNNLGLVEQIKAQDKKIVIVENHIKYIRQVKLFDEIQIETQMEKSAHFLLFKHILTNVKTNKPVAKASVKTLFLGKDDRPCDIPQAIIDTFTEE